MGFLSDVVFRRVILLPVDHSDPITFAEKFIHHGPEPEEFAVGVDLFGVSNWVRTLQSIPPYWESFRKSLYKEIGDPNTDLENLRAVSPLFHADKIVKPLIVLQGANDPRVIKPESDEIVDAIKKKGGVVEYVVFDNEGHGFTKKANEIRGNKAILDFLDKYLKGSSGTN